MLNVFKAIGTVITVACNVVIKLLTSAEKGANALAEMAEVGEMKAKNYKDLVVMNDEQVFELRRAEINQDRIKAGLPPLAVKSQQEQARDLDADKKAKDAQAKKDAENELDV